MLAKQVFRRMIEDEVWSFYTYPPTRNKVGEREEGRGELGSLGNTLYRG